MREMYNYVCGGGGGVGVGGRGRYLMCNSLPYYFPLLYRSTCILLWTKVRVPSGAQEKPLPHTGTRRAATAEDAMREMYICVGGRGEGGGM